MKVRNLCDYCGGWDNEADPRYKYEVDSHGNPINCAMKIDTRSYGSRHICADCLVKLMDRVMQEIKYDEEAEKDTIYR